MFYANEHEPVHVHGKFQDCESRAEIIAGRKPWSVPDCPIVRSCPPVNLFLIQQIIAGSRKFLASVSSLHTTLLRQNLLSYKRYAKCAQAQHP